MIGDDDLHFPILPATQNPVIDETLVTACNAFMAGARALVKFADTPERARALASLDEVLLWTGQAALRDAQASAILLPRRKS
jgi:hypothetical protein